MTHDEFRDLLTTSVALEVEYDRHDGTITVKLVSTESNSSFDPKVLLSAYAYIPKLSD